jgi:hypothetical protein
MLHRIIKWITNPFKTTTQQTNEPNVPMFKIPEKQELSPEQVKQLKTDLIEAVKEFRSKVDLDSLPIDKVSDSTKESIASLIKEDIGIKQVSETTNVTTKTTSKRKRSSSKKKKNFNEKKSE